MLNVSLIRTGTNNDGTVMYLEDATEWESEAQRSEYNLFIECFLEKTTGGIAIPNITENLLYVDTGVVHNGEDLVMNGEPVNNTPLSGYIDVVQNVDDVVLHNGVPLSYDKYPIYTKAITGVNFEVPTPNDGYYKFNMVAVSTNLPYIDGEYGTDAEGRLVQLVDNIIVLRSPGDLVDDPYFSDWVTLRTLLIARLSIYTNEKYVEYFVESSKYFGDAGHYPELYMLKRGLDYAKSALNSAQYVWELDNYTGAQSIIENMEVLWQM